MIKRGSRMGSVGKELDKRILRSDTKQPVRALEQLDEYKVC